MGTGPAPAPVDLARFLSAFDDRDNSPLLSHASIDTMFARPTHFGASTWWYGMGWLVNTLNNQWHDGALDGTFTFMVRRFDGVDYVALFNRRTLNSSAIDNILYQTANGIATWPTHDLFDEAPALITFGDGCASSTGVPVLRIAEGTAPTLGTGFAVELVNLPVSSPAAFLVTGASNTVTQSGLPLPFDLAIIGAPMCNIRVDPVDVRGAVVSMGTSAWGYFVPNLPVLVGASFYLQGGVLDVAANPLGIALSAGGTLQIGE